MRSVEFLEVLEKMLTSFDKVMRWFDALEKQGRASAAKDTWFKVLEDISREEALEAIDRLMKVEEKPRSAEDYPSKIRRMAIDERMRKRNMTQAENRPSGPYVPWPEGFWVRYFAMAEIAKKKNLETIQRFRIGILSYCRNSSFDPYFLDELEKLEAMVGEAPIFVAPARPKREERTVSAALAKAFPGDEEERKAIQSVEREEEADW